jgi:hypothetical protein
MYGARTSFGLNQPNLYKDVHKSRKHFALNLCYALVPTSKLANNNFLAQVGQLS